jgi:hypothetical protein
MSKPPGARFEPGLLDGVILLQNLKLLLCLFQLLSQLRISLVALGHLEKLF